MWVGADANFAPTRDASREGMALARGGMRNLPPSRTKTAGDPSAGHLPKRQTLNTNTSQSSSIRNKAKPKTTIKGTGHT
eukprot:313069-Amphidinium_carterae.1